MGSLENVIRGYLRMAEERTEVAQQQSSQAVLDIDDLDNLATPESILMSAVCGEDAQDRSDRTILLPWVKFLWESYCQCLELLRINTHCETLYHDIARMAFHFCLKYNRKMEFRKLCEKLRKHLEDISKPSSQTTGVSINKSETQQLNLDTRLYQLDSAIQMELWQEAYKAIEDIHGLMTFSKKTPVAKTMANYYQKLAMVFWKAGNQLFHAAALLKLFQLTREMKKNITSDELQRMASHVLVATIAIPLPSAHPEFDRFIETDKSPLEKAQRLAVLLGLQQPPTRISLLKDMIKHNVVSLAAMEFQNLHRYLEIDFDPLHLCSRVQSIIENINSEENGLLKQYVNAIQDVTLVRLIRQICQVYQSIEFTRLLELAKFADPFYLERILVDCVRHNDMQIRIDHKNQSIQFGTDLTENQKEDQSSGPTLQIMPSEQVRSQLVNMSIVLHRAIHVINPTRKNGERKNMRLQMVKSYHENKIKEHQRILQRQKIIEDRKEFIERLNTEREEEEIRKQEEFSRQQKIAEQKRIEQELEEREKKRQANEIASIKEKSIKEKINQISQTPHGQKVLKKLVDEEIKKMDAEQIAAKEAEELLKEKREQQTKLKSQEKKVDYFERAKRIEEIPLIEKYLSTKQIQDKQFWEEQEENRIETAINERKNAVAQSERLQRMYVDRDAFLDTLRAERNSHYLEKLAAFNTALQKEKKERLHQRVLQRREDRRLKWIRDKEEEKRRREEEIRKQKEEEEAQEKERKAKIREAELEKLRIQTEKQRAREEEIERKLQEENEALKKQVREENVSWRKTERTANVDDWRSRQADSDRTSKFKSDDNSRGNVENKWRRNDKKDDKRNDEDGNEKRFERDDRKAGQRDDRKIVDREDRRIYDRDDRRAGDRDEKRTFDRDDRKGFDRDDRRIGDRDDRRGGDRDDRRAGDRDDRRAGDRDDRRGGERDDRRGGERDDRRGNRPNFERRDDRSFARRDGPRDNRRDNDRDGGDWRRKDTGQTSGNWRSGDRPKSDRDDDRKEKPERNQTRQDNRGNL